jgi:uncharacterized protein (TIGR02246 family)
MVFDRCIGGARHSHAGDSAMEGTMKKIACFTLMLALVCASSLTSASASQAPAATASNIDAAIRAVADAYVNATLAADAKAIADLYTDDAIEMPPNLPLVKGRAAIQQYYEKQFAAGKIARFSLTHLETRAIGDTGYDVGTYQQNITPATGAAIDDSGKFTVILKRTGGRWKVAYAIYNSDRLMQGGSTR